jgi:hypothetical protein
MTAMPYGGVINWRLSNSKSVHDLSVHHGYRHLVAWGVHMGSYAYYIELQCQRAQEMGAPEDAIYLSGSEHAPGAREWRTFSDLQQGNPSLAPEITKYVEAIERLEEERKAARR